MKRDDVVRIMASVGSGELNSDILPVLQIVGELERRYARPRYRNPGDYLPLPALTKEIAGELAITSYIVGESTRDDEAFSADPFGLKLKLNMFDRFVFLRAIEGDDFPYYWASREIATAANLTQLPQGTTMQEIDWPRRCLLFLLPRDTFTVTETDDAPIAVRLLAVGGMRVAAGEEFNLPPYDDLVVRVGQDGVLLMAILSEKRPNQPERRRLFLAREDELDALAAEANVVGSAAAIKRIAINLSLLMQARPSLVENARSIKQIKRKGGGRETLWEPRWIGRKYRYLTHSDGPHGTHKSPRMHWRMGHWRNQVIGPRVSPDHKLMWIEPSLVNAVVN